jgi:HK97 family phage major capsid protein
MDEKQLLELIGKAVNEVIDKRFDEIKASIAEAKKENNQFRNKDMDVEGEKSVMKLERKNAPFVKLGSNMEKFCSDLKMMIKGAPVLQSEQEKAAFNSGTDGDGGYTVPTELEAAIMSYVEEEAIVRPRATVIKMKSDTWKKNKLDQSADNFGGVTVSWVGESNTTTDTKFALKQISMVAKKMLMLTTESREILSDSNIDFANYVVNIFGRAAAYFEDYEFLNGHGVDRPLGVLYDTDIPTVNRAVADQVAYADVISMFYALKPQFRRKAIWIGSTGVISYLDGLVDSTTKRPLWADSYKDGTPPTLKGKPFIETEKCAELGNKGDLAFVDFSWYYIGDREGITVDASIHDRFRYDEITVRLVKRVDGVMGMKEAAVVLDVPSAY